MQQKLRDLKDEFLSSNHLFCSAYTSLGIANEAFKQDDDEIANNFYNVHKSIVIGDTFLKLISAISQMPRKLLSKSKAEPVGDIKLGYAWYMVGRQ